MTTKRIKAFRLEDGKLPPFFNEDIVELFTQEVGDIEEELGHKLIDFFVSQRLYDMLSMETLHFLTVRMNWFVGIDPDLKFNEIGYYV